MSEVHSDDKVETIVRLSDLKTSFDIQVGTLLRYYVLHSIYAVIPWPADPGFI